MAYVTAGSLSTTFNAAGDARTFSFDAGSSSNRFLIIHVLWRNSSAHTVGDTAVTYAGVTATAFGATVTSVSASTRTFYITGPASGANDLTVDPSTGVGTEAATVAAYVYDAVDQTTPYDGYITGTGTDMTAELTVTSATGDTPVYLVGARGTGVTSIAPTNYTERIDVVNGAVISGGGEGTGAASVAFTGTISAAAIAGWVTTGMNLNASGGAASSVHRGLMIGVGI